MKHKTSLRGGGSRRSNPAFFSGLPRRSLCSLAMTLALFICLFSLPVRAEPDVTTGLVGWWKLDETSGTTAVDSSGISNDATMQGGMDASTDSTGAPVGTGLTCSSSLGHYMSGAATATYQGLSAFTFSAWVNVNDFTDYQGIIEIQDIGILNITWGDSSVTFQATGWDTTTGNWRTASSLVNAGQWAHVAVTYDYSGGLGAEPQFYVDGVAVPIAATAFSPAGSIKGVINGTLRVCVAEISGLRELNGSIDEARIYNRVLSAEDIAYLYQSRDGNIKYDQNTRVPKYFNGDNWQAMGKKSYIPNAVTFDGTNDYLTYFSPFTGVTDGTKVTASFWYKMNTYPSAGCHKIVGSNPSRFDVSYCGNGTETMQMIVRDTGGAIAGNIGCGPNPHVVGQWYHHLISVDVATGATNCYVNDADSEQIFTAPVNTTLDLTMSQYSAGAATAGTDMTDGDIADLWVDFNTYIDFSVASNRRKFIDADGNPVYLGADGSIPTGSAPDIFLSGDTATWHTNDGTGGGFTENGALTDSTTAPGDVYYSNVPNDSLIGWWKLDETSGLTAVDSSGNGHDGTMLAGVSGDTGSVSGVMGNALYFPLDKDARIEVPHAASLDPTGDFSLSFWMKPLVDWDDSVNRIWYLFSKWSGNFSYEGWYLRVSGYQNEALGFQVGDGVNRETFESGGLEWDANRWYYIGIVYDTDTHAVSFYRDGSLITTDNTSPLTNSLVHEATDLYIGDGFYNTNIHGYMDDVRIYDRELTAGEISALYNSGICTNPTRINGSLAYNADSQVLQYCDSAAAGNGWKAMGPVPGTGAGGCSNPTKAEGSLIFNKDNNVMQYCDGDNWVVVGGAIPCGGIGGTCADGTIFAGLTPDGNVPMYTTPVDSGTYAWNDGTSNWLDTSMVNCTDSPPGTALSCRTGEANTALLVGLSGSGSPAPYTAAEFCDGLVANGRSDWYLPAMDEMFVLYSNRSAIGGFTSDTSGGGGCGTGVGDSCYWTSSEYSSLYVKFFRWGDGNAYNNRSKEKPLAVRCVRK